MTLTEYSIFTTIAQTRSLTLTSEALHISKSAVHHALGKIENELGMPLFERTKSGLDLTYYGEQLLPYANEVLRSHEHFNDRIQNLHGMESGIIRLGTCSSICSNWIPDIISEFKEKHPNIEVQVRGGSCNKYIIDCLLNNEIDIGIGSAKPSSSLDVEDIYTDEMLCIAPPDIRLSHEDFITAEELSSNPLLIQEPPFGEEQMELLDRIHANPTSLITGYDDATLIAMVESSLGYCVMGKLCMKRVTAAVKTYSFEPQQYRVFSILTKHGAQKSPAAEEMCKIIRKYAADFPTDYTLDLLFMPNI